MAPMAPFGMPPFGAAAAPVGAGQTGGGLSPKDITQILRKRFWLILIIIVLFTTIAGVATYLWWRYAPNYTAQAALEVQTPMSGTNQFDVPTDAIPNFMPQLLATHASLLLNDAILQEVAQREDVRKTRWAQDAPKGEMVNRLKAAVRVAPRVKTNLIYIMVTMGSPEEAAIVANALGTAYQLHSKLQSQQGLQEHSQTLNTQINELQTELDNIRMEIENLTAESRVADLAERGNVKRQELEELQRQAIRLRTQYLQAKTFNDRLLEAQDSGVLLDQPEVRAALYQDPNYAALRQQEAQWSTAVQNAKRNYGPLHSSVAQAEAQLNAVAAQLAQAQDGGLQAYMARNASEIKAMYQQLAELQEQAGLIQEEVRDLYVTLAKLRQLRLEESNLSRSIDRMDVTMRDLQYRMALQTPVTLVQALPPSRRSQPKPALMITGGVVLGIIVALGLTVLLEIIDTSIKRPSDIRRRIDIPLLGMVPHLDDLDEDIPDPRLALQMFPDSPVGEAFRQIRTRVIFSAPLEQQRVLMVTSPLPEDGRTTVAVNLAMAMTQAGSKVLLVDANFRQPMLHQLFEGVQDAGLSNALIEQDDWRNLVFQAGENLHILPAGPLPPSPAELLAGPQMKTLIDEALTEYDRILFDSAPCLVVTDPCVLASVVDGVIMVFRAGANTHGVAMKARDRMNEANARLFGAVLNGVQAMPGGYLRKNYEAFYEYRERQPLPA